MFEINGPDMALTVTNWCKKNLGDRWGIKLIPNSWTRYQITIADPHMLQLAILKFS